MDLFAHPDYRSVLRAWIDEQPKRSQTSLARRAGASRSLVAMVLAGERDLSLSQSRAWGTALGLDGDHLAYWEALVRSEHGESLALRRAARAAARALADFLSARRPDPEDAALLGRWYVPVILELQRCEGFRPEVDWLMARLWPTPDTDELTRALRLLREGDLLGDRRSVATERQLDDEAMARMARAYHRQQLEHASQAIDEVPSADRYLGSLSVAVRRDDLPALIEALHLFQLSVIEPHRAVDADLVVQVNVQLFPRTRE